MENNAIVSNKQDLTYSFLWKYKDDDLSLAICLSEFIDNSISSCEKTYWDKGIKHDLEISITFNYDSDEKEYIIEDNAGGMDVNELDNAMRVNKYSDSIGSSNTDKNQYGIGMKSAIFWIGNDGVIYTKKNNVELCGKYLATTKKESDPVLRNIYESKDVIDKPSGTKIIISGCYGNDRSMTEKKWDNVEYFLGNRYSKYLVDENSDDEENIRKCKITIYSDSFEGDQKYKEVRKLTVKNDNPGIYSYNESNSGKFNKESVIKLLDEKLSNYNGEKSYEEFKDKLISGKRMKFNDIVGFCNNKYHAPVKIYILARPSEFRGGLAIVHSFRYIYHPVKMDKEKKVGGLYLPFKPRFRGGQWKWLRFEIELDKIESNEKCTKIKPEKNKKSIIFDSNSDISENDFWEGFQILFNKWIDFAEIIKEITSGDRNKESFKKLEDKKNDVRYNDITHNLETTFKFSNLDKTIKVEISPSENDDPNFLISFIGEIQNEDNSRTYKYEYNNYNAYFSKVEPGKMQYTLKLLLYLDIYYNQNKNLYDKTISEVIREALEYWSE